MTGADLRAMREARGLTQQAVASAVGTTQQTIDRIESGQAFSRYRAAVEALLREPLAPPAIEARLSAALLQAAKEGDTSPRLWVSERTLEILAGAAPACDPPKDA